jgi:TPR repeat protein
MRRIATLASILSALVGCAATPKTKVVPSLIFGNQSLLIDESAIPKLQAAAEAGDAEAGYRLYLHYACCTHRKDQAMRYLRLAAATGSLKARYALGLTLLGSQIEAERDEGIAVLVEAADDGSVEAKDTLAARGLR